jgi:hypothetical protein
MTRLSNIRLIVFLLIYFLFSALSAFLFASSLDPNRIGADSLVSHINYYVSTLTGKGTYYNGYGDEIYWGLYVASILFFFLTYILLRGGNKVNDIFFRLLALFVLLMTLANISISWAKDSDNTLLQLVQVILFILWNLIGMIIMTVFSVIEGNKEKAIFAGFLGLGNSFFLFWAQYLSGVELLFIYFVVPMWCLFIWSIILILWNLRSVFNIAPFQKTSSIYDRKMSQSRKKSCNISDD